MGVTKSENSEENSKNEKEGKILVNPKVLSSLTDRLEELEKGKTQTPTDQAGLIEALTSALTKNTQNMPVVQDRYGFTPVGELDPDDLLSGIDVIKFYAHRSFYVIVDDVKMGRSIQTPFGNVIKLTYESTKGIGTGRTEERHHLCSYISRSKKEAEWLEKHHLFGIMFFKSSGEAMSIDNRLATQIANLHKGLMGLERNQLLNMARENNIEMMEDLDIVRNALANKMARKIENNIAKHNEDRVRETAAESLIVGGKG